jgi:hypothetical protein
MDGVAFALLNWIDLGGIRTPLYKCELDSRKLRHYGNGTYRYGGVTIDPRFPLIGEQRELSAPQPSEQH